MPVAYLTGRREFWSLPLKVTPAVLVPRHETELLVEMALERAEVRGARGARSRHRQRRSRARHRLGAAARARHGRRRLAGGAGRRPRQCARLALPNVTFRLGSWFDAVPGERFDVIVANPPYVADGDPALAALAAEPALALVADPRDSMR